MYDHEPLEIRLHIERPHKQVSRSKEHMRFGSLLKVIIAIGIVAVCVVCIL